MTKPEDTTQYILTLSSPRPTIPQLKLSKKHFTRKPKSNYGPPIISLNPTPPTGTRKDQSKSHARVNLRIKAKAQLHESVPFRKRKTTYVQEGRRAQQELATRQRILVTQLIQKIVQKRELFGIAAKNIGLGQYQHDPHYVFECMDTSGDLLLDLSEFTDALTLLGLGIRRDEAAMLFKAVDVDNSGEISRDEFIALFNQVKLLRPEPKKKPLFNKDVLSMDALRGRDILLDELKRCKIENAELYSRYNQLCVTSNIKRKQIKNASEEYESTKAIEEAQSIPQKVDDQREKVKALIEHPAETIAAIVSENRTVYKRGFLTKGEMETKKLRLEKQLQIVEDIFEQSQFNTKKLKHMLRGIRHRLESSRRKNQRKKDENKRIAMALNHQISIKTTLDEEVQKYKQRQSVLLEEIRIAEKIQNLKMEQRKITQNDLHKVSELRRKGAQRRRFITARARGDLGVQGENRLKKKVVVQKLKAGYVGSYRARDREMIIKALQRIAAKTGINQISEISDKFIGGHASQERLLSRKVEMLQRSVEEKEEEIENLRKTLHQKQFYGHENSLHDKDVLLQEEKLEEKVHLMQNRLHRFVKYKNIETSAYTFLKNIGHKVNAGFHVDRKEDSELHQSLALHIMKKIEEIQEQIVQAYGKTNLISTVSDETRLEMSTRATKLASLANILGGFPQQQSKTTKTIVKTTIRKPKSTMFKPQRKKFTRPGMSIIDGRERRYAKEREKEVTSLILEELEKHDIINDHLRNAELPTGKNVRIRLSPTFKKQEQPRNIEQDTSENRKKSFPRTQKRLSLATTTVPQDLHEALKTATSIIAEGDVLGENFVTAEERQELKDMQLEFEENRRQMKDAAISQLKEATRKKGLLGKTAKNAKKQVTSSRIISQMLTDAASTREKENKRFSSREKRALEKARKRREAAMHARRKRELEKKRDRF
eukprot:g3819.t1